MSCAAADVGASSPHVSGSRVSAFDACETAWEAHFPGCGCATGRTKTEDGKESGPGQDAGAPQVHCASGGVCLSYTP